MGIERITSAQNPKIKELLALQEKSRLRRERGLFVVEGRREVEHCLEAGFTLDTVFYCPDIYGDDIQGLLSGRGGHGLRRAESLTPSGECSPKSTATPACEPARTGAKPEGVWDAGCIPPEGSDSLHPACHTPSGVRIIEVTPELFLLNSRNSASFPASYPASAGSIRRHALFPVLSDIGNIQL